MARACNGAGFNKMLNPEAKIYAFKIKGLQSQL
jgi:hypothetical protein